MKTKEISRKSKIFYVFLAIVVILFFLDLSGISDAPSTVVSQVIRPIQIGLYKTGQDLQDFFFTASSIGGLRESEQKLKVENATLLAENVKLKKIGEENEALRAQLGFKNDEQKLIAASIIGRDPKFLNSQVLLDVGTKDGVKKEDIVIFKNILIGKIGNVSETSATLVLLSDPTIKVPAVSENGAVGLVGGNFGNSVKFSKIPQNQPIKKGEMVFSSGEAGFPKNLVLGAISETKKNAADIFQEASIEALINTKDLKAVFIIKDD